jgi:MFS family permease
MALVNLKVLYFGLIYFTIQSSVYGVTFYLPTLIADMTGTKVGFTVGLLTAIPWICAMIAVVVLARIADRTGRRRWVAASALAGAGLGILLATLTASPVFGLVALSLAAAGFISVQPVFWTLPTGFLVGGAAAVRHRTDQLDRQPRWIRRAEPEELGRHLVRIRCRLGRAGGDRGGRFGAVAGQPQGESRNRADRTAVDRPTSQRE